MGHRIAVLNAGRLQQLGTPMELYRWPSNLFVAQFIGSPPMNLLAAEVAGPGQILVAGRRFAVEGPLEPLLGPRTGESLTAGLRPEHLRLAPATNRNLAAEVCHVEALGNEQLVTCRLRESSQLLLVRAEPEVAVVAGEAVHLEVDPSGWRLFDGAGEALLPPGGAIAERTSTPGSSATTPRGPQLPRIS